MSNATNIIRIDPYTIGKNVYTSIKSHALENVLSMAVDFSIYKLYYHDFHYKSISSADLNNIDEGFLYF